MPDGGNRQRALLAWFAHSRSKIVDDSRFRHPPSRSCSSQSSCLLLSLTHLLLFGLRYRAITTYPVRAMETIISSHYRQTGLPKLHTTKLICRRDSLSSSRTRDSGYNSDLDSLSPVDILQREHGTQTNYSRESIVADSRQMSCSNSFHP